MEQVNLSKMIVIAGSAFTVNRNDEGQCQECKDAGGICGEPVFGTAIYTPPLTSPGVTVRYDLCHAHYVRRIILRSQHTSDPQVATAILDYLRTDCRE